MTPVYGQIGDGRVLAGVAALHVVVLLALLSMEPMVRAVGLPQPLMVSLLAAEPEPRVEPPKPLPPKPQAHQVQPLPPPPVLAAREDAPAPSVVPLPPLEPMPMPVVLPAPVPEPVRQVAAPAPPPPAPISPPRFDADYLDNPAPAYPALSNRLGEQGQVLLRVFVSPDGHAAQVEVRESSGYERLDKAARDTVRRWRFAPARQGEKNVAAWVLVPISFSFRS